MHSTFLLRSAVVLVCWWGSTATAYASHALGADLAYQYAGTATNPYQYHVTARLFDAVGPVTDTQITLTCGKNECGTTLPGSFVTTLMRTSVALPPSGCASAGSSYEAIVLEGMVQLSPAHWTLSIDLSNRAIGVINVQQSFNLSTYVKAVLDNSTGLVNSSPQFTTFRLIQLYGPQFQRNSLNAFDAEGDSLLYELVQPLATPTPATACGMPTVGDIAPHFQINAATGELLTVATGPIQQGRYAIAGRVSEYRRLGGSWQQVGSITRDMTYFMTAGANQMPTFTRVAPAGSPASQLLGQTIRVAPGQSVALLLTATDPDAGQTLTLSSNVAGLVPGATFQPQGNGQGLLTWQVPVALPPGRYFLTVSARDNACPTPGASVLTLSFLVTPQALAARARQLLAQAPFPMPFVEEVRFQLAGTGKAAVTITDGLGRTLAQLTSDSNGEVRWRPAATLPAGLYLARNANGTQLAPLLYSGR